MLGRGWGRGAESREEVFNSFTPQLLCDYVYDYFTRPMDKEQKEKFDGQLEEIADEYQAANDVYSRVMHEAQRGEVVYV